MDPNTWTHNTQTVFNDALQLAQNKGNPEISDLHLFHSLMNSSDGIAYQAIEGLNIDVEKIKQEIRQSLDRLPTSNSTAQAILSSDLAQVLVQAEKQAKSLGDSFLSTEHLLLALALTVCQSHSILDKYQVNFKNIKDKIIQRVKSLKNSFTDSSLSLVCSFKI